MTDKFVHIERESETYLRNISKHTEAMRQGYRIAFYNIGLENVTHSKMLILKPPKTGRLYRIPGRKKRHRASAPGEPPANLKGNLRRGVDFIVEGSDKMTFGEKEPYGRILELGGRRTFSNGNSVYIEPRPYLIRAVKHNSAYAEHQLGLQPLRRIET